jgi:FtsZ-interacting cell division protein ZipA
MTDLQISLIAAGGVCIAGLISYNKWQEYKAKKSIERAFSSEHDDVLMNPTGALRHEPTMAGQSDAPDSARHQAQDTDAADMAVTDAAAGHAMHAGAHLAAHVATPGTGHPPLELPIDGLIDCVIPMNLEAPLRGEKLLPVLQSFRHVGNKPIHYIGYGQSGHWEPVAHGGVYTAVRVGVQLASRSTALNELEYSELVTRLRQIADELGADSEVPDMIEVMARARSLHQFVTEHDAQLGVNIHSNGAPWAINTLLIALEKQGFDLRPDGRFVMPDGEGKHLFSLSTNVTLAAETTSRLTLLLDVPCVTPQRDGFGAMVACAKALVTRLDGTIVDDGNTALSDMALGQIAGQVNSFYEDMQSSQIPAGSTRALRLFS